MGKFRLCARRLYRLLRRVASDDNAGQVRRGRWIGYVVRRWCGLDNHAKHLLIQEATQKFGSCPKTSNYYINKAVREARAELLWRSWGLRMRQTNAAIASRIYEKLVAVIQDIPKIQSLAEGLRNRGLDVPPCVIIRKSRRRCVYDPMTGVLPCLTTGEMQVGTGTTLYGDDRRVTTVVEPGMILTPSLMCRFHTPSQRPLRMRARTFLPLCVGFTGCKISSSISTNT